MSYEHPKVITTVFINMHPSVHTVIVDIGVWNIYLIKTLNNDVRPFVV